MKSVNNITISTGQPLPLGATVTANGVNFAIFSRHATRVWLLLFDQPTNATPSHRIALDPAIHRTGDTWHIHLNEIEHGQCYLYQMDGPYVPSEGHRFNKHKPLLDPYAKAVTGRFDHSLDDAFGYDPADEGALSTTTNFADMPKCIVYGPDDFDWQGTRPLNRPLNETVIYETHVRSLTCHPETAHEHPGTFHGVIERIPYFQELGITAVELLPIHLFDEWEFERYNPLNGERLRNYWGYNSLNFFAPHNAYSHLDASQGQQVVAFKEMVRALHQAGIEVILDVVYNHTVENDHIGRTLSYRGIDNTIYYMLEDDKRHYRNFSGVGNTLNCGHPVVQDLILDSLRYWVQEMHVDGFRFDLTTVLARNISGEVEPNGPLLTRIAEDPLLRNTKLIAEPWDIGGYQVGNFNPDSQRWLEWNDKYRDEVRRFWRGDAGHTSELTTRIAGSADLYYASRTPGHSINFLAAHDGFTLNDLVSYNEKHNEANGEANRDGHGHNFSHNHGLEGTVGSEDNPEIEVVRNRQVKNLFATLLLSQGTPMINGGDEFRRTQGGNNNAYCQHNEVSWYDWRLLEQHSDIFRFVKTLIAFRQAHPILRRVTFLEDSQVRWYNAKSESATWAEADKLLMCVMSGAKEHIDAAESDTGDDVDLLMIFNADTDGHDIGILPSPNGQPWGRLMDTALDAPDDIVAGKPIHLVDNGSLYTVQPRSTVVLASVILT
ncbi:MAG: glycogen debranching protein GlgX [Chloroflexota bacterium]